MGYYELQKPTLEALDPFRGSLFRNALWLSLTRVEFKKWLSKPIAPMCKIAKFCQVNTLQTFISETRHRIRHWKLSSQIEPPCTQSLLLLFCCTFLAIGLPTSSAWQLAASYQWREVKGLASMSYRILHTCSASCDHISDWGHKNWRSRLRTPLKITLIRTWRIAKTLIEENYLANVTAVVVLLLGTKLSRIGWRLWSQLSSCHSLTYPRSLHMMKKIERWKKGLTLRTLAQVEIFFFASPMIVIVLAFHIDSHTPSRTWV